MLRVAHLVFARPSLERPVPEFAWEAARAVAGAPDMQLEVLMPQAAGGLRRVQGALRRKKGARPWPPGLEQRLLGLQPRPTLLPFVPIPGRSIEAAALALAAQLACRPQRQRPQIVQGSFLDEGGYVAVQIAKVLGVPSVVVAHGSDVRAARGEFEGATGHGRRRRALRALQGADRVVAVSHTMAAQLEQLGSDSEVIPFTSSSERYQLRPASGAREVMFVGRVGRDKGVDLLLEAWSMLGVDDWRLRLVGPVLPGFPLQELIEKYGLASQVVVHGEVTQDDLPQLYADCAATVLPSRAEGLPCVVVESLLCGRPVVATNVGGVHELVSEDTGALVVPRDAKALLHGLRVVMQRSFEPEPLRAQALPYAWERCAPRLLELLRQTQRR